MRDYNNNKSIHFITNDTYVFSLVIIYIILYIIV